MPKYRARGDSGGDQPDVHCGLDPCRDWYGPHMATLADEVGGYQMLFSLLEIFDDERCCFGSPEPASEEDGDHGIVRLLRRSPRSNTERSFLPGSAVNQVHIRIPCFFTPLTRRIPAARSGLRSPQSAASYANRRMAARRRLMVEDA
jgi:hypothetical protein